MVSFTKQPCPVVEDIFYKRTLLSKVSFTKETCPRRSLSQKSPVVKDLFWEGDPTFYSKSLVDQGNSTVKLWYMRRTKDTHGNTLQYTARVPWRTFDVCAQQTVHGITLRHAAIHCNTLQRITTHCNTLQHTATHCNTLQHTARVSWRTFDVCAHETGDDFTFWHAATHCNTLQHTATHCNNLVVYVWRLCTRANSWHCHTLRQTAIHCATHCNTLQDSTTHYNTLQHTATHCNTPQIRHSHSTLDI